VSVELGPVLCDEIAEVTISLVRRGVQDSSTTINV
jgi:hypothetical protein